MNRNFGTIPSDPGNVNNQYIDISDLVRSGRENSEPQYSNIPVAPLNSIGKPKFQKTTGVSLVSSENKTRRILEALIIVFCLFTFGFLVLYFLYGSNASASEAARIGFTAGAIIFTVASTISAILLVWYAKKTCGANQM